MCRWASPRRRSWRVTRSVRRRAIRIGVSTKLGNSVWGAVPMHEDAFALRGERSANIVVGVDDGISGIAVADLQVNDVAAAAVDQVVGVARAGFEAGAHARTQRPLAGIGDENGFAL